MPRPHRKERLDELLLRELESIISYEMEDPRLANISVSRVDVTRDLMVARVYITLIDDAQSERQALAGLESAHGFIRHEIAGRLQLRRVPDLVFRIDRSLRTVQRLDAILDAIEYSPDFESPPEMQPPPPEAPTA